MWVDTILQLYIIKKNFVRHLTYEIHLDNVKVIKSKFQVTYRGAIAQLFIDARDGLSHNLNRHWVAQIGLMCTQSQLCCAEVVIATSSEGISLIARSLERLRTTRGTVSEVTKDPG